MNRILCLAGWTAFAMAGLAERALGQHPESFLEAAGEPGQIEVSAEDVPSLIEQLNDDSPGARLAAVQSLAKLGAAAQPAQEALVQKLDDDAITPRGKSIWRYAAHALGRIGTSAIPEAQRRIQQQDARSRIMAAIMIHEIGPPAKQTLPVIQAILREDEEQTRIPMIYALVGLKSEAAPAMDQLLKLMRHEDFHTRYWACRAAAQVGFPHARPAVPVLIDLLEDPVASVRGNAAAALGNLSPAVADQAAQPLANALSDGTYNVRVAAAVALGKLGEGAKVAAPALEASLSRPSFAARSQAAVALWRITKRPQPAIEILLDEIQGLNAPWDAAEGIRILGGDAAAATARLVEISRSDRAETRVFAAYALGGLGPAAKDALPRLKEMQEDSDEGVRQIAAQAVESIETPKDKSE